MANVTSSTFEKFNEITSRHLQWYYTLDSTGDFVVGILAVDRDGLSHSWSEPSQTGTEGVVVGDLPHDAIAVDALSP